MRKYWILLGCIALLALILGAYSYARRNAVARDPMLSNFTVSPPNFVAEGWSLSRVEVWAVPAGTGVTEHQKIGKADLVRSEEDFGTWLLDIPPGILATQIYAQAYGPEGEDAGRIFLPYLGATELYQAIYPGGS